MYGCESTSFFPLPGVGGREDAAHICAEGRGPSRAPVPASQGRVRATQGAAGSDEAGGEGPLRVPRVGGGLTSGGVGVEPAVSTFLCVVVVVMKLLAIGRRQVLCICRHTWLQRYR